MSAERAYDPYESQSVLLLNVEADDVFDADEQVASLVRAYLGLAPEHPIPLSVFLKRTVYQNGADEWANPTTTKKFNVHYEVIL